MSELTTVARPYAKAAFAYGVEQKRIAEWQQGLAFAAAVATDEQMQQVLSGAWAAEKTAELFIQVCDDALDDKMQNFIRVLAENQRLAALPQIAVLFDQYKTDYDQRVDVDITSAQELTKQQMSDISASLEQRLARKVNLNCTVDPALVAGVVIRAGDTVIDGSIRSKLNRLADALQA